MVTRQRPYARMLADEMWKHDGKPDGKQVSEVGQDYYADITHEVLESMDRLGLKVVRRVG